MIYKMNGKEIRELLFDFFDTRYGKSMFLICYAVPFISFVVTMGWFFALLLNGVANYYLVGVAFLSMNVFCLGSYFYYKELREYAEHRKK